MSARTRLFLLVSVMLVGMISCDTVQRTLIGPQLPDQAINLMTDAFSHEDYVYQHLFVSVDLYTRWGYTAVFQGEKGVAGIIFLPEGGDLNDSSTWVWAETQPLHGSGSSRGITADFRLDSDGVLTECSWYAGVERTGTGLQDKHLPEWFTEDETPPASSPQPEWGVASLPLPVLSKDLFFEQHREPVDSVVFVLVKPSDDSSMYLALGSMDLVIDASSSGSSIYQQLSTPIDLSTEQDYFAVFQGEEGVAGVIFLPEDGDLNDSSTWVWAETQPLHGSGSSRGITADFRLDSNGVLTECSWYAGVEHTDTGLQDKHLPEWFTGDGTVPVSSPQAEWGMASLSWPVLSKDVFFEAYREPVASIVFVLIEPTDDSSMYLGIR